MPGSELPNYIETIGAIALGGMGVAILTKIWIEWLKLREKNIRRQDGQNPAATSGSATPAKTRGK